MFYIRLKPKARSACSYPHARYWLVGYSLLFLICIELLFGSKYPRNMLLNSEIAFASPHAPEIDVVGARTNERSVGFLVGDAVQSDVHLVCNGINASVIDDSACCKPYRPSHPHHNVRGGWQCQ